MKREFAELLNYKRHNFLLLDFCNLKEITHNSILNLQKKYKIIHSDDGDKRGYEDYCLSKQDSKSRRWALVEGNEIQEFKNNMPEGYVVLPSQKNGSEILRYLSNSQTEYNKFLSQCAAGHLDLVFINEIMQNLKHIGLKLEESSNKWSPSVTHGINHLMTFESYINWEILNLFFIHAGPIFKRVQICNWQNCGKYFLHKRKDQKYCSDTCSRDMRHDRFRKTKGYEDYRIKSRVKGIYIKVKDR